VKRAIEVERFHRTEQLRSSKLDRYVGSLLSKIAGSSSRLPDAQSG
jgi:hypothetical protein